MRYTLGTDNPKVFVERMSQAIDSFSRMGYNTVVVKNTWIDSKNPYKGINTVVAAPNGLKFEVQYHTKESFEIKEKMHGPYEKTRVMKDKRSKEYLEIEDEMFNLSDSLTVPDNIEEVKSYGK